MAPNPNISVVFSDVDKQTFIDFINNARALITFGANLTPEKRHDLRKTGSKREGYVEDVYAGSIGNSNSLPADFQLDEWTKDENLNKQVIEMRVAVESLAEMLNDTLLVLGNERIKQADTAYGYLKIAAKSNTSLTELVSRIGRQFIGQGRKKAEVNFNIPPKGRVEVDGVVPGTKLVNTSNAIICMKAGAELAKIVKKADININPGSSVTVPTGYKKIIVENLSETEEGSFAVHTS